MPDRIEFVKPFTVDETPAARLLFSSISSGSIEPVSIKVPVSQTLDYETIVQRNDDRIKKGIKELEVISQLPANDDDMDETQDPQFTADITELKPTNYHQQVCTVIIRNFPRLKPVYVEKIIGSLLSSYTWYNLSSSSLSLLFVRADNLADLKSLHSNKKLLEEIADDVTVWFDEGVDEAIANIEVDPVDQKSFQTSAQSILNNPKTKEDPLDNVSTEDLDQVLKYYNSYTIDPNELVEVPKNMKDKIKKAIIRFRSRVVIMEKNKRRQEIANERLKSKKLISKIIQATNASSMEEDTYEVLTLDEPDEDQPDITDDQYEEIIKEKQQQTYNDNYKKELIKLGQREDEKQRLLKKLEDLKNYEDNLIDNKFKLIEDLKNFEDYSMNNTLSKLNLFYTNYPEYVRNRNRKRQREDELDEKDREEEEKETKLQQKSTQFISKLIIQKPKTIQVNQLSDKSKNELKDKVGELIEEYLGIKEEVLIEFIINFLNDNNLNRKEDLINDLSETLDEDSKTVVNELHDFIKQLS